jgi:hypothetical protein
MADEFANIRRLTRRVMGPCCRPRVQTWRGLRQMFAWRSARLLSRPEGAV